MHRGGDDDDRSLTFNQASLDTSDDALRTLQQTSNSTPNMKKLFSRKKRGDPNPSPTHASSPYSGRNESGLRTSFYDTTTASGEPQTGDYPIRGNDTPNVLRKKPPSRRSSIRSWRSTTSNQPISYNRAPTPDQYGGRPGSSAYANGDMIGSESYAPQPVGQRRWSRTQLPQEFSNMSLSNEGI